MIMKQALFDLMSSAVVSVSVLSLVACASGGSLSTLPAPVASSTSAAKPFVGSSAWVDAHREPGDAWWQLYDDETLSRLVAEALDANNDLKVAVANLANATAILRESRGGRYPTTQISGGVTEGRNLIADSIGAAFHGHADNQTTYLGGVDISYELDLYGRVARSIDAATADAESFAAARDAVRVMVAAETTRAYATMRSAAHELHVARRSVQISQSEVDIVQRQMDAGAATPLDLARVRVVADQARAQVPAFEGRQRAALLELTALLGRVPSDMPSFAPDHEPLRLPVAIGVGDGAQLLARRPDVRQAERRLAAAVARIDVATASLYPRVVFGANLGLATNEVLRGSNAITFAVGPLVSWSFPNQAIARSRIEQSNASAAAALAVFDGTVLRALKEVEQSIAAYDAERTRRRWLAEAMDDAAKAYGISGMRQREGVLSRLDLLVAEQTLVTARAALAAADSRVVDTEVNLFKALGGGWRTPAAP